MLPSAVPDQGGQFMGEALQTALAQKGIDQCNGAIGSTVSIAIIERLRRTAKD